MNSSEVVGQVGNLRPIVNRPGAGPDKLLRRFIANHDTQGRVIMSVAERVSGGRIHFPVFTASRDEGSVMNSSEGVGQVANLRPIVNRPGAGPGKLLRSRHNPRIHRIHYDIPSDPPKLRLIPNHAIIALFLPERSSGQSQNPISLSRRESLERLHQPGNLYVGSDQHVHMVRHDDVAVQMEVSESAFLVLDGFDDHARNFRLAKVQRACSSGIEKTIHCPEGLSGGSRCRKTAAGWEAAVQTPSEEHGSANGVVVREAPSVKVHPQHRVRARHKFLRPIDNRPQVLNLPYSGKRI